MRDCETEVRERVEFIREQLEAAGAKGLVYGSSGGKDSALVGILCKIACQDTLALIMPCGSKRNYEEDRRDALEVSEKFSIETRSVDLTAVKAAIEWAVKQAADITDMAGANINPRLRMTALYAVAASENRLVVGTGNRSEAYMGYFTKYGDGAFDFNPIADLTVTEEYELLRYLKAPESVINKAPSAALFDGQTDEGEMGITYASLDKFLLTGETAASDMKIIGDFHAKSEHKRLPAPVFGGGC
jgi:NAD+ synthase